MKILIILNRKSGRYKCVSIYNKWIKDSVAFKDRVLLNINFNSSCSDTNEQLKKGLVDCESVMILGGDGTVNSIINFMIINQIVKPICHVPCGTGNGLCKSILWSKGIEYSIKNAIEEAELFIANNETDKDPKVTNGDMIHSSNQDYQKLLSNREDLNSYQQVLHQPNSKYQKMNNIYDRLSTVDLFKVYFENQSISKYGFLSLTWGIFSNIDIKTESLRWMGSIRNILGAVWELLVKESSYGELIYQNSETGEWEKIYDKFYYFTASNVSHVCHDVFIDPDIKYDDGYVHIGYLSGKDVSRWDILKLLLSFSHGTSKKYLKTIKTKSFVLKPKSGKLVLDGELVKRDDISVKVARENIFVY